MRETSAAAYKLAIESGLITKLKLQVFEKLCAHGPMTANELRTHFDSTANSGVYSTRLSELERMGVVQSLDTKICSQTHKRAHVWRITGRAPVKPEPVKTKSEKKEEALEKLRALYQGLPNQESSLLLRALVANVADLVKAI